MNEDQSWEPARRRLEAYKRKLVESELYSCFALEVSSVELDAEVGAYTLRSSHQAAADSVFDLASLTKPFLSTLALWLASREEVDLHAPVYPGILSSSDGKTVSLEELLRHRGGVLAWWPLYREQGGVGREVGAEAELPHADLLARLTSPRLWGHSRGCYSDIGYMTVARWLEDETGRSLPQLLQAFAEACLPGAAGRGLPRTARGVLRPTSRLAMDQLSGALMRCTIDTDKEVELAQGLRVPVLPLGRPRIGEVQDGNARYMARRCGLLAGHAGLFADTRAVAELGVLWLRTLESDSDYGALMRGALEYKGSKESERLLGWFGGRELARDSTGKSVESFFHTGFVGGGVWLCRRTGTVRVMLAHRRDPLSDLSSARNEFVELEL